MIKKRKYILGTLIIICLFISIGCSVRKNVKDPETKEFTKSILESNEKVKSLKFYFVRPYLGAEMVYEEDLSKEDFQYLIDEFKLLIDIDFMQRIGEKYWKGGVPWEFILDVYVDRKPEGQRDYQLRSRYNKEHIRDEEPDNIDGYKTWHIEDKNYNEITLD